MRTAVRLVREDVPSSLDQTVVERAGGAPGGVAGAAVAGVVVAGARAAPRAVGGVERVAGACGGANHPAGRATAVLPTVPKQCNVAIKNSNGYSAGNTLKLNDNHPQGCYKTFHNYLSMSVRILPAY